MAVNISNAIREKIYDMSIDQRLLFVTDDGYGNYIVISNEDISVNGGVTFLLEGINTQPMMFGCTPMSSIKLEIVNHISGNTRRYRSADLGGRQFKAYFGIQEYNDTIRFVSKYRRDSEVVAACKREDLEVVMLKNGKVLGNRAFGTSMNIYTNTVTEGKIAIVFDTIYIWYKLSNNTTAIYKIRKNADGSYGNMEAADQAAITYMNLIADTPYMCVSYGPHYMEFGYPLEKDIDEGSTWGEVKEGLWDDMKGEYWSKYSGRKKYTAEQYYCIPFGVWNTDVPRRTDAEIVSVTAHDNMSVFDVDSFGFVTWLKAIRPQTKLTPKELVQYICQYCGVKVSSLVNFSYMGGGGSRDVSNLIDGNTYLQMKTCKDLLSYALEVGATNGLIDRNGCFKTFHSLVPGETNSVEELPFVYTTDIAEFTTPVINKVLVAKVGENSFYSVAPDTAGDNCYEWSDNPFFNSLTGDWWTGSDNISILGDYRDAIITGCANYALWVDDLYSITVDGETLTEPIFQLTLVWNAHGTVTYTNYGCEKREQLSYDQRESGQVNGSTKTVPDNYNVIVGDSTKAESNKLSIVDGRIILGNELPTGSQNVQRMEVGADKMQFAHPYGDITCDRSGMTFVQNSGYYMFPNINVSAQSSNMCIDPSTGMITRVSSLRRNKDHIETIDNPWSKVDNLRGVSFISKCGGDPKRKLYGFIAEEVEDAVPELAEYDDATLSSVQYDRFTALLIEDCKESHKRIRDLENRLNDLEGRLNNGK